MDDPTLLFALEGLEAADIEEAVANCKARLSFLLKPSSRFQLQVLRDCQLATAEYGAADGTAACELAGLAQQLAACGHQVTVRHSLGLSQSLRTRCVPSHSFIVVTPPPQSFLPRSSPCGDPDSTTGSHGHSISAPLLPCSPCQGGCCSELLVEPRFRSQFMVARCSTRYQALVELLPELFVGPACQLVPLLDWICREMAFSFNALGDPVPPWRHMDSMVSMWLPLAPTDVAVRALPAQAVAALSSEAWDARSSTSMAFPGCSLMPGDSQALASSGCGSSTHGGGSAGGTSSCSSLHKQVTIGLSLPSLQTRGLHLETGILGQLMPERQPLEEWLACQTLRRPFLSAQMQPAHVPGDELGEQHVGHATAVPGVGSSRCLLPPGQRPCPNLGCGGQESPRIPLDVGDLRPPRSPEFISIELLRVSAPGSYGAEIQSPVSILPGDPRLGCQTGGCLVNEGCTSFPGPPAVAVSLLTKLITEVQLHL